MTSWQCPKLLCATACAIILLTLIGTSAVAQTKDASAPAEPSAPTVKILAAEMPAITDSLTVKFVMENPTKTPMVATPILDVPEELMVGSRKKPGASGGQLEVTGKSVDLNAGETEEGELSLTPLNWREAYSAIGFRCHTINLRVRLVYEIIPGERVHQQPRATKEITPQGPWIGVAAGAVMAVLVVIAFGILFDLYNHRTPQYGRAVLTLAMGCATVIISSFVFRFLAVSIPQLPLAVNVKDILGGALLGLVFRPLIVWLARLLGIQPPAAARG